MIPKTVIMSAIIKEPNFKTNKKGTNLPEPTAINADSIMVTDLSLVQACLQQHGIAVVPLNTTSKQAKVEALDATKFYSVANAVFKPEYAIKEPTLEEKLNPATYKTRKAPDAAMGWIHQYATPLHTLIQADPTLRATLESLYGKSDLCYSPNRIRVTKAFKFADKSLHIEGLEIFKNDNGEISLAEGEVATIVGVSGLRRFVFWDMNDIDLKPLYDYWLEKNNGKTDVEFTLVDPTFMHKHYPGRRRMVTVDCNDSPMLILWRENVPHEMALSPSVSLFISPVTEHIKKVVTARDMTTYAPPEFEGLTEHETHLLAMPYQMNGFKWPSGKKTYPFCHIRPYKHYIPKVRERYTKPAATATKPDRRTIQMRLPHDGTIDQHTAAYKAKLARRNIVLPAIAFAETTPNFVTDISEWPEQILRDHGYITAPKTTHTNTMCCGYKKNCCNSDSDSDYDSEDELSIEKVVTVEEQLQNQLKEAENNGEVIDLALDSEDEDTDKEEVLLTLKDKIKWKEMTLEEYMDYRHETYEDKYPETVFWIHETDCLRSTGVFEGYDELSTEDLEHFNKYTACYIMEGSPCYIAGGWDCECQMAQDFGWTLIPVEF
jgi:hypothetical protein